MALYVLTGEIASGKTTTLFNEIQEKSFVGGFLSPVNNNIRQFYLIRSQRFIPMEQTGERSILDVSIGKYVFDSNAFTQATIQFETDWELGMPLLILDEFGPLEFKNQGLYPKLKKYLNASAEATDSSILVVLRTALLDLFLKSYTVESVLYKEDLAKFIKRF